MCLQVSFDAAMLGRVTRALLLSMAILSRRSRCRTVLPIRKNVACRNDGECHERGGKFNYCLQNRCLECVGNSRCKIGFLCVDGECTLR
jgi:hypothetical protein